MKFALLHLALLDGPIQRNLSKLIKATEMAATAGAELVITPEMAVQGYRMSCTGNPFSLLPLPSSSFTLRSYRDCLKDVDTKASAERLRLLRRQYGLPEDAYNLSDGLVLDNLEHNENFLNPELVKPLQLIGKKYKLFLVVGCGTVCDNKTHNSAVVINPQGEICAYHHKLKVMKGETEGWSSCSDSIQISLLNSLKAGLLVCSDTWYEENGAIYGMLGAELMITIAAWPDAGCGGPPPEAWKRCSKASGGLPLIVCNQTGKFYMDCTEAESALIAEGEIICSYKGDEAVLLGEYDQVTKKLVSKKFEVLYL